MASSVTYTSTLSDSEPTEFILPDLVSDIHYPLRLNPRYYPISRASEEWLLTGTHLTELEITTLMGLRAGELAAACYPDADAFHLRVCSDFFNWLSNMDDWLDAFDVDSTWGMRECCISALRDPINSETEKLGVKMCKSYFSRFRQTSSSGCTERFIRTMDLFFIAVAKQADDRAKKRIPDLKSYITVRRDTSACKPCFVFIEYAAGIDLPDEVMSHPVMIAVEEATNDFITWSNDIFSYNVEQSRHDTHNLVVVLMREQDLNLQGALDYSDWLCKGAIQRFEHNRAIIPSWGRELDKQVAIYLQGLQDWIIGVLHWSFDSTRYFGKDGHTVKRDRIIRLLPKRPL
ncbi:isoprenoid synthase domain-containing protein [Suillus fuscotomentosus]|uniref:Terpene synthase n=1 Tax=Suillus fuscotomentosus TaxID=1912939 RepID=A0AAD4DQ00_9AGAM|nr:isoprenoid synthase domain-containing protein [Suillus fuscotomentosus]KAG1889039.1 isoprenoid synthase domain-containing protein [Suillus fuscotomentosus]